jgi:DNA-binding transcriptional regulator PaaX
MNDRDFGWMVGIIEGEGSILVKKPARFGEHETRGYGTVQVCVRMTDHDIMLRLKALLEELLEREDISMRQYDQSNKRWKRLWHLTVSGMEASRLLQKILPYLGERRKEAAMDAIDFMADRPGPHEYYAIEGIDRRMPQWKNRQPELQT